MNHGNYELSVFNILSKKRVNRLGNAALIVMTWLVYGLIIFPLIFYNVNGFIAFAGSTFPLALFITAKLEMGSLWDFKEIDHLVKEGILRASALMPELMQSKKETLRLKLELYSKYYSEAMEKFKDMYQGMLILAGFLLFFLIPFIPSSLDELYSFIGLLIGVKLSLFISLYVRVKYNRFKKKLEEVKRDYRMFEIMETVYDGK